MSFVGTVRDVSRGDRVTSIFYDVYEPLALSESESILWDAQKRWNVLAAIHHRIGLVLAGETSIVIAVSSPHRSDAFQACAWVLEQVKSRVPIWKHENYEGGWRWIEGSEAYESRARPK